MRIYKFKIYLLLSAIGACVGGFPVSAQEFDFSQIFGEIPQFENMATASPLETVIQKIEEIQNFTDELIRHYIPEDLYKGLFPRGTDIEGFLPGPAPVVLQATPSSPSPGETVTIVAKAPTVARGTGFFEWTINGAYRADLSGTGRDSIQLTAGNVGSAVRIGIRITQTPQDLETASLTIYVSDLALSWHADTYTPAWYKGRALPVPNSSVSVVAIPSFRIGGVVLRPENLIYYWSLGTQKNVLVGRGQQKLTFKTSDMPSEVYHIRLTVEDSEKRIVKEGSLVLQTRNPTVTIYEATALGGPEVRRAVTSFSTTRRGLFDFHAEPFFFPVSSRTELTYDWTLGNALATGNPENPYIFTIDSGSAPPSAAFPLSIRVSEKVRTSLLLPLRGSKSINVIFQ